MAMNVMPFVGTDNFNMETFNNMISQINNGVNSEISEVLAQLGTKAKIQTGSYVGTGTYGADNPCSLTFDFVPLFLMICRKDLGSSSSVSSQYQMFYCYGMTSQLNQYYLGDSTTGKKIVITASGNTVSWNFSNFNTINTDELLNTQGTEYQWVAIG